MRVPAVALLLALPLATCTSPRTLEQLPRPALPTPGDARAAYDRACAPCHGRDGRGAVGPDGGRKAPDLTLLAAQHDGVFPRAHVIAVITGEANVPAHGDRAMPVWKTRFGPPQGATAAAAFYERRRVELLADHVASLQRDARVPAP